MSAQNPDVRNCRGLFVAHISSCCSATTQSSQLGGLMTTPLDRHLSHSERRNRLTLVTDAPFDPRDEGPDPDPTTRSPYSLHGTPAPLAAAAVLTFVEGLLTVVLGITESASLDSDRLVMGLTTGLFFLACGVGLLVCAWGLNRVRPVSYTHLRAHETDSYLVCRLLLEK